MHAAVRYLCCGDAVQRVRGMSIHTTTDIHTTDERAAVSTSHGTQILQYSTISTYAQIMQNVQSNKPHTHTRNTHPPKNPTQFPHPWKTRVGMSQKEGEGKRGESRREEEKGGERGEWMMAQHCTPAGACVWCLKSGRGWVAGGCPGGPGRESWDAHALDFLDRERDERTRRDETSGGEEGRRFLWYSSNLSGFPSG